MLDAEVGQNADSCRKTGPVAKKGSRLPFHHPLIGYRRIRKKIDAQEAPAASHAERERGTRIVAQHIEAQGHRRHSADFTSDGRHAGNRFRGHGLFPEGDISVVLDAERVRSSLPPRTSIRKSALHHGIESSVIPRGSRQRSQVHEADQELRAAGGQGKLHESGHGRIFTESRARDKSFPPSIVAI